ncbi:hypothetical protein WA158_008097 [Blastocystis sp. Blastoise]
MKTAFMMILLICFSVFTLADSDDFDLGLGPMNVIPVTPGPDVQSVDESWTYWAKEKDPGKYWYTEDFDTYYWDVTENILDLTLDVTTVYYRTTITVPFFNPVYRYIFRLNMLLRDGAVVYVNGIEVYRVNLPAGYIPFDQAAADTYITPQNIQIVQTTDDNIWRKGVNTIAVEIHRYKENEKTLSYDFGMGMINYVANKIPSVVSTIKKYSTSNLNMISTSIDNNGNNSLRSEDVNCYPYISVEYDSGTLPRDSINTIVFRNRNNNLDMDMFNIEGSTDGIHYELIYSIPYVDKQYLYESQSKLTYHFMNNKSYRSFRVNMYSSSCNFDIEKEDIYLFATPISTSYCKATQLYPKTYSGTSAFRPCNDNLYGYMSQVCTDGQWEKEEDHCQMNLHNSHLYTEENIIIYKHTPVLFYPPFSFSNYIFSINDPLPEGLSINEHGIITGKPLYSSPSTTFMIYAQNPKSNSNIKFPLTFEILPVCFAENEWKTTLPGEYAYYSNIHKPNCPLRRQCIYDATSSTVHWGVIELNGICNNEIDPSNYETYTSITMSMVISGIYKDSFNDEKTIVDFKNSLIKYMKYSYLTQQSISINSIEEASLLVHRLSITLIIPSYALPYTYSTLHSLTNEDQYSIHQVFLQEQNANLNYIQKASIDQNSIQYKVHNPAVLTLIALPIGIVIIAIVIALSVYIYKNYKSNATTKTEEKVSEETTENTVQVTVPEN